ncbi:MAG: FG-GAP-like repeat-containing protein [Eubacteriales bacterium]|nr:FG-GAP-like repeat-containing protein [Eubacteriales bacterium]
MKKLSVRFLSVVLTVMILSSVLPLSVIGVSAQAEGSLPASADAEGSLPAAPAEEEKSGTYTLDEIYTEYLFSHTDKSSELDNSGNIEETVANANEDSLYADFKFSQVSSSDKTTSGTTKTMEDKAEDILNDTASDNPLAGYSFARPKELLIAQINRENQHEGEIRAVDNVSSPINELGGIDNLKNAGEAISLSEEKSGQTHNTIGIDYNGDGIDELAYFSLYADGDGYASVRTYKRSGSGSSLSWSQVSDKNIMISDKDDILDIETQQSRGYTSMTAGDFDGDGKEELACYFPCANNGNGTDSPFVGIIDISDDGSFSLDSMKRIHLSSIRSDLDNLKSGDKAFEDWYMPIVALSTTSIRANGAEDTEKSYDDLVINISIPRVYHDDDDNMNSCIAVYSYNNGSYDKKFSKDLRFGTDRMVSTNSVDADLNGDGYNELVVAGLYEYDVSENKATNKISTEENLVQLISWDGSSYNFVWSSPKKVAALGNIKVDWDAQEPIALTAGRYNPNTANTLDYLCVQGVVLSCKNTKVYGIEKRLRIKPMRTRPLSTRWQTERYPPAFSRTPSSA